MSDITYYRGDSYPKYFNIKDSNGVAEDITTWAFTLTVSSEGSPSVASDLFSVAGVIEDGPAGRVSFTPTVADTDQNPQAYFYDIQSTVGSQVRTLSKARLTIKQDITK